MNNCIDISLTQEVDCHLPPKIQDIFACYALSSKNIRNKTVFCISNIQSAYIFKDNQFVLKHSLHTNEQDMINKANRIVHLLNQKNDEKYQLNCAKSKENKKSTEDKVKEIKQPKKLNVFGSVIDKNTFYQSVNKTFIETLIREQEVGNIADFKDYTIVNSVLAQNVVHKVCDDFSHYYKALTAYFKSNDGFSGRPAKPSYKGKTELSSFEVSALRFNNNGSILTITKNHKLFFDFKKQKALACQETIDFYNNFDFKSLIEEDMKKKNLHSKYSKNIKITLLRVVPTPYAKSKFKLQYTISFPVELKGYYADLIEKHPDFMKEKDSVKYKLIKSYLQSITTEQSIPSFASMDLGHRNIASIYYFNGLDNIGLHKADIISANNFISRINKLDNKIDKRKSNLYNPKNAVDKAILDILSKIERNKVIKEFNANLPEDKIASEAKALEPISQEDKKLLIEHSKNIYGDKLIGKLTYRKNNTTKDYLHKLSSEIVKNLVNKDIKLLIIGKNDGWKQEIDIGVANNRKAYNLPHTRLIELLKYKCILKNILIIEQEESYTSKTSFACNEALREYSKGKKHEGNNSQLKPNPTNTVREGQRLYKINANKKSLLCHADLNGAMNIGRKVLSEFNIKTLLQAKPGVKPKELYQYRIVKLRNYGMNNTNLYLV